MSRFFRRYTRGALTILLGWLAVGCGGDPDPFLSEIRVAPGGDQLALAARGRLWIASSEAGSGWSAVPLTEPGAFEHVAHPAFFPDGKRLALSVWVDGQADLAIANLESAQATVERLGPTSANEFLQDVAPDGKRLLFQRAGELFEYHLERGVERRLGRGGDARYAGPHTILFAQGHQVAGLGRYRQRYRGGDQSEICRLSLRSGRVEVLSRNDTNDIAPLPLAGRPQAFVALSEKDGRYEPWFCSVEGQKLRIRRPSQLPPGPHPILWHGLRAATGDSLELWMECNGRLYRAWQVLTDSALVAGEVEHVPIALQDAAPAKLRSRLARTASDPAWFGRTLLRNTEQALGQSPLTVEAWHAIPPRWKRRLEAETRRVSSQRAAVDLVHRLLGQFGMSHLYYEPPWPPPKLAPIAAPEVRANLRVALAERGVAYLAIDRLDDQAVEAAAELPAGATSVVLDLRDNRGGYRHDAFLEALCSPPAGTAAGARRRPLVVLVSRRTYSSGEVVADGVVQQECGILIGEPTAGAGLVARAIPQDVGGRLFVPETALSRADGTPFENHPVVPHRFVRWSDGQGVARTLAAIDEALDLLARRQAPARQEGDLDL